MSRLSALLDEFPGDEVYQLEQAHGMLTATLIGPHPVTPGECIPFLFSRDGSTPSFIIDSYSEILSDLLIGLKDHISIELDTNCFKPFLSRNMTDGKTSADPLTWCIGFIDGMGFWGEEWFDEQNTDSRLMKYLSPFIYFADRGKTLGIGGPEKKDNNVKGLEKLLVQLIPPCVWNIRQYWREHVHSQPKYDCERMNRR